MEDNSLGINVQIEGFRIPLRIPRGDEEMYRKAEKLVVKYIEKYQHVHNQRTYEEILKLVAFQLATNITRNEMTQDLVPLADKIRELEKELDIVLNEE